MKTEEKLRDKSLALLPHENARYAPPRTSTKDYTHKQTFCDSHVIHDVQNNLQTQFEISHSPRISSRLVSTYETWSSDSGPTC